MLINNRAALCARLIELDQFAGAPGRVRCKLASRNKLAQSDDEISEQFSCRLLHFFVAFAEAYFACHLGKLGEYLRQSHLVECRQPAPAVFHALNLFLSERGLRLRSCGSRVFLRLFFVISKFLAEFGIRVLQRLDSGRNGRFEFLTLVFFTEVQLRRAADAKEFLQPFRKAFLYLIHVHVFFLLEFNCLECACAEGSKLHIRKAFHLGRHCPEETYMPQRWSVFATIKTD